MNKWVVAENWAEHMIQRAERAVEMRSAQYTLRHKIVFWTSIIVIVKINLAMAAVLIPFLAAFNTFFFDGVILLSALIVGVCYDFLLSNVAHLEKGHHFLAVVLVPLVAITNVFLIGGVVGRLFGVQRSLWLIAILYGAIFIVPYVYRLWKAPHRFINN